MEHVALVIAPHPDDAEIGMGGTIAALVRQGINVTILDLTDGEPTPYGSPEIRARETARATEILGIKDRRMLGLKNREVFDTVESRKAVANVIREIRPSLLFVPYWEDAHPDHIEANALSEAARFYSKFVKSDLLHTPWHPKKVLSYFSTHLRVKVQPSFVYDISESLATKMDAIRAYESQFVTHPSNAARLPVIEREALYWGDQVGTHAGEPFVCRENIRLTSAQSLFTL